MSEGPAPALPRVARFALVGVVNTLLDLAVFTLLVKVAGVPPPPANAVSYSCGLLNSFALNRKWTFAGEGGHPPWLQLILYVLVNLGGLGFSTLIVWALSAVAGPLAAKVASVPAVFAWNYLMSRLVVFRPQGASSEAAGR